MIGSESSLATFRIAIERTFIVGGEMNKNEIEREKER